MRLFATGAMNWVMGRALPDDVPIEAKMVTKAIERAQNTVEGRNAESRKDVLKYDDVMNEQRKVIYGRRIPDHRGGGPARGHHRAAREHDDRGGGLVVPVGLLRGVGPAPPDHRGDPVLPDQVRGRRSGRVPARWARSPRASSPRPSTSMRSGTRASPEAQRPPASSNVTSCCRSSTSGGRTTWPRWTTSARASISGPWATRIRWWPTSARASPCSASSWTGSTTTTCATSSTSRSWPNRPRSPIWSGPTTSPPTTRSKVTTPSRRPSPRPPRPRWKRLPPRRAFRGERSQVGVTNRLAEDGETQLPIVKSDREKLGRNDPCWCGSDKKFKLCHGAN